MIITGKRGSRGMIYAVGEDFVYLRSINQNESLSNGLIYRTRGIWTLLEESRGVPLRYARRYIVEIRVIRLIFFSLSLSPVIKLTGLPSVDYK